MPYLMPDIFSATATPGLAFEQAHHDRKFNDTFSRRRQQHQSHQKNTAKMTKRK